MLNRRQGRAIALRSWNRLYRGFCLGLSALFGACASAQASRAFETQPQPTDAGCYEVHTDSSHIAAVGSPRPVSTLTQIELSSQRLLKDGKVDRFRVRIQPPGALPQARLQYWVPVGSDSVKVRGVGQHAVRFEFRLERYSAGLAGSLTMRSTYDEPEATAFVRLEKADCEPS